ncbi:aldehyde dehydrogenase family protein [Synoicihabitans lomoniglobus]|uniref:Aldehyde dehydrogenase family protein n=1 Tax=Synoicihabitans lomoniglobus TaxID=2909285 RepID=A0AAF0CMV0_9BACT|nr:aldehyde dehydrogenase family protein [Opitutaceae bacterium LMO-M01]WED64668.1 aldehyde dehydrogenase family protein [Opitutaceae bacterium LMO-M01]
MSRLSISKTPKCYVGGKFIRSESGRTFPLADAAGEFFAHIPQCTRKDVRNAVEIAAKAGAGWADRSGYNRGQILYRLAEMMEPRAAELEAALKLSGATPAAAAKEVSATIDRTVHFAGWTDKYEQLLGSVNPVASPHFNFTVTEPTGVVAIVAPDEAPLLALITLVLPAIVSGNSVIALASETAPYPAIVLGEMLATSDLPGGVVNLLTGLRKEIIPTFATHAHIRAVSGAVNAADRETLEQGAADSVKRVKLLTGNATDIDWLAGHGPTPSLYAIRDLLEFKTTWHPVGA